MNNESSCNTWLSVYIYFKGGIYEPQCDKVILDVLAPFINESKRQKLFEKYFFIRYNQFGSHIRLRFYGCQEILNRDLKPNFEKYITCYEKQDIFALPQKDSDSDNDKNDLLWIPYEPEIERYGGDEAIKIAEEFFYYSSETGLKLLKKIPDGEYSSRLGKGLLSMIILLFVFTTNRQKKYRELLRSSPLMP